MTTMRSKYSKGPEEIKVDEFKNDIAMLRSYLAGGDAFPEGAAGYVKGADKISPYQQAFDGQKTGFAIMMGREADTASYKEPEAYYKRYEGRISNCELEGVKWTLTWNRAYWAGGIDAKRPFQIITPLRDILGRAKAALRIGDLGGAFPEIFWLLDNGYRLENCPTGKNRPKGLYALPPAVAPGETFIDSRYEKFCLSSRAASPTPFNVKQIQQMIARLEAECIRLELPDYEPTPVGTLGSYDSLFRPGSRPALQRVTSSVGIARPATPDLPPTPRSGDGSARPSFDSLFRPGARPALQRMTSPTGTAGSDAASDTLPPTPRSGDGGPRLFKSTSYTRSPSRSLSSNWRDDPLSPAKKV